MKFLSRADISTRSRSLTLNEAKMMSKYADIFSVSNNLVFLSHKHTDKDLVKDVAKILQSVNHTLYIDWLDPNMPKITQAETAKIIREKIKYCSKFILLATNEALSSMWCNWELGVGDVLKAKCDKIAIFPITPNYGEWEGNEYLGLYPTIEYSYGISEQNLLGLKIPRGYYVSYNNKRSKEGNIPFVTLKDWLNK